MKRIVVVLAFLIAETFSLAYGQQNQTESLTFTTYYPSPHGVYSILRFSPNSSISSGNICANEGELSYSLNDHELLICKGIPPNLIWQKVGSGSGLPVQSDHGVSPDQCDGIKVGPPYVPLNSHNGYQLCGNVWYQNITFSSAFSSAPKVYVTTEYISDRENSPCARGEGDRMIAYADNITEQGFQLHAAGSPEPNNILLPGGCGNNTPSTSYNQDLNYTRALVGWLAIAQ